MTKKTKMVITSGNGIDKFISLWQLKCKLLG